MNTDSTTMQHDTLPEPISAPLPAVTPVAAVLPSVVQATWNHHEWRLEASCRDLRTELFFPVGLTGEAIVQADLAKKICSECPSQNACLEFALRTHQDYGVWGGATEDERRIIRRQRRQAARRAQLASASAAA
jgi:WhiB family transcriptional regulator, redox-sensing transcriptional regulator